MKSIDYYFNLMTKGLIAITNSTTLYDSVYSVPDFPQHVNIEVTNRCNASCPMCPMQNMKRKEGNMSFSLFQKIVDECADNGVEKIKYHIAGEPLIHPKLEEMIEYSKEAGIPDTHLTTNASLLTKERGKKFWMQA